MSEYEKYLRANGATDAEIAVLVTPTSERAFTKQQTDLVKANTAVTAYTKWFNDEATPAYQKMLRELVVVKANEARARTALLTAQEKGLLDITKDLGYEPDPAKVAPVTPALDPNLYIDRETFKTVLSGEGDAIAAAQDIAFEHARLFPDKPINFRKLRQEAVSKGVSVEQVWMDTFGVESARTAQAQASQAAHDKKMRDEGAAAAREEFANTYGNPNARPLVSSTSPFAPRPNAGRDKQPWETGDRSIDRVQRATRSVVERFAPGGPGAGAPRAN